MAITHGMAGSKVYYCWIDMRRRCYDQNNKDYPNYGGRGIAVCDEWRESFEAFYAYIGDMPEGMSLGRENNDGNYEPSNVRLETAIQQNNNKGNNRYIEYKGKTQTVSQWAYEVGLNPITVYARLNRGDAVETALESPVKQVDREHKHYIEYQGKAQTIVEWSRDIGVNASTISKRLQYGWTVERALTTPTKA